MGSLTRKMQRKLGIYEPKAQYTKYNEDGGYTTLHPTKGFQKVSAKRIRAQERMIQMYGFIR